MLFVPSKDRSDKPIDQDYWVGAALPHLGSYCIHKVRRLARRCPGGKLLFDEPVIIQCYTSEEKLEQQLSPLRDFLHLMGREARQGAIGLVVDRDYLEISFPLEKSGSPSRPKKGRR